ncbi:MAG: nicotinate-nucleotide adenylyltransferase [Dehalococcoidia bacterium]
MAVVGVLGGTFDPVHTGHLIIAQEVALELGLELVYFIPVGQPPLKQGPVTPAAHRLEMLRLALAGNDSFHLSTLEVERPGPSYTVDTLRELGRSEGREVLLILGWDAVADLPRWSRPQELLTLSRIAAVPRPGTPEPDVDGLEKALPGLRERLRLLSGPVIDISASEIRRRVARGLPVHHLLPPAVEQYIREQGLYREG